MTEDEESGARRDFNLLAQVTYLFKSLGQEMVETEFKPRPSDTKVCVLSTLLITALFIIRATIVNVFYVYASRICRRIFMTSYIVPSQHPHEVCNMDKQERPAPLEVGTLFL